MSTIFASPCVIIFIMSKYEFSEEEIAWYMRFARRFAYRYAAMFGFSFSSIVDDLVQEAMLGMLDAAKKYDPARRNTFRSYVTIKMCGRIISYVRKEFHHVVEIDSLDEIVEAGILDIYDEIKSEENNEHEEIRLNRKLDNFKIIDSVMPMLSEEEKSIVKMIYVKGMSYRLVGKALGRSKSSVWKRHQGIIEKVRIVVKDIENSIKK